MATRLAFTTADLVTCTICIREFDTKTRKPKSLHCGHSLCAECAETLREPLHVTLSVRCPTCRQYTSRLGAQECNTNYQFMGYLAEKERLEKESMEKGEKTKKVDKTVQIRLERSNNLSIHIAVKKDLPGPELYMRKDSQGATTIVIAGKTGSPEEIVNYVNECGLSIETGKLVPHVVHEGKELEKFSRVSSIAPGQSAMKCAKPNNKLEDAEFSDRFELKAVEKNGSVQFEFVRKGDLPKHGFNVFNGCMTKPSAKRLRQLTAASTDQPSTSKTASPAPVDAEPAPKRSRRPRRAQ